MVRLFGTDGVRGLANRDITADLALKLGWSAAHVLETKQNRVIIGRDTRVSGEFISAAMSAGLASAGVDVIDVGVLPTPAIAFLTAKLGVDFGVVISASHNPMQDNGIKFFGNNGYKLPDNVEDEIEACLENRWEHPTHENVGRITNDHLSAKLAYLEHLTGVIGVAPEEHHTGNQANLPLSGLEIVLDGANGAASEIAPEALRICGANVTVINASPDGYNINLQAGSTHPEQLQAIVKASGADLGVAFDGDADRLIAVDEKGELIDGDKIITMLAVDYKSRNILTQNKVVLTVMSNLGTKIALEKQGIDIEITGVGDRYVLERMIEKNLLLGGEQSGHIINLKHSTTGDGTLSALLLANCFATKRKSDANIKISDLAKIVTTLPQILINVPDVDKNKVEQNEVVQSVVKNIEEKLGDEGRVLLRASGTESLIRVMVEAKTQELAQNFAEEIAEVVRRELSI